MESFNLKSHKKIAISPACFLKEAGSPVSDFTIPEIEEMATYLGYYSDRTTGSHRSWVNRQTGRSFPHKNIKGRNPGYSFYAGLKEHGFTKKQIQYYRDHSKELIKEKKDFLKENPNAVFVPRLEPKPETITPAQATPPSPPEQDTSKELPTDWDNPVYKGMWDQIKEEVGQWVDDENFDDEILAWLSNHYGVPAEELRKRMVFATLKKNWYKKAILIPVTNSFKKQAQTIYRMSIDEWESIFKPIEVHPEGSWNGWMLETYGEDLIRATNAGRYQPDNIWTILDSQLIVSGYQTVNRFGYILTRHPFNPDYAIEVYDEDAAELDGNPEGNDRPEEDYQAKQYQEIPVAVQKTQKEIQRQILDDAMRIYKQRKK